MIKVYSSHNKVFLFSIVIRSRGAGLQVKLSVYLTFADCAHNRSRRMLWVNTLASKAFCK